MEKKTIIKQKKINHLFLGIRKQIWSALVTVFFFFGGGGGEGSKVVEGPQPSELLGPATKI